jgi:tetratricopeptide (TPR) repeat protein
VQALHEETDGNPFFLEEVVRHLADQDQLFDEAGAWRASPSIAVPDTIRLTVGRRLDVLTDKTHTLLTNAAIIGRAFGFQLLEALTDLTEDELVDALDEAERARLIASSIDSGGVRFRFEHELIRHTLVEGVSLARRQLLHQRVADAIERVHAATIDDHVSDLAYHLLEAGDRADPTRTLRFLVAAGERALEAAAYEEALRHLERALAMTPADDLSGRARILEELAMAHRSLGRPAEAIASWSEALDAYESLGDLETVARVCLDACIQVSWWANRPETFELIERGLRATRDEDDPGRAALLAMSAVMSSHLGSYHDAEEKLERALELARAQDNGRVLGVVLFTTCAHHFNYQQHEKAVEIGRVAIDQLRDAGDLWNLANVQGFVGQSLGFLGRFDEAATATEGAKALAERLGNWVAYVYIDRARAWRHMSRSPDPERLDADGVRDVELGEQLGYGWMSSLGYTRRSFAAFLTGRWEDALSLATESSRYEFGVGHGHLGRLVLLQAYLGDRDASCDAFERLRPGFPQQGDPAYVGAWDSFLAAVEGMAMLDEREALAELHPRVIDILTFNKLFRGWDYRLVLTVAGMSATCAGLWTEAEAHFTEAMRIADTLPYPTEQPEARRFYAWMLLQRDLPGDRSKAAELLQEAIAGYHHIGMPRHEALAAAMLQNA